MATKAVVSAKNARAEAQKPPSASPARPDFVPAPVLFTIKQAAIYLGATVSAVRNLIWDDDLRVVVVGQRHMLRVVDLDGWVRQNSLLASDIDAWKKARKAVRAPRRSRSETGTDRVKSRGKSSESVA
jgi:excisionase family DNA binding protein